MGLFNRKSKPAEVPEATAASLDNEFKPQRAGQLIVWFAKDGWRWRLWAPNGKLVAESGESYIRRYDCVQAAQALADRAAVARLEVRNR